MDHGQLNGLALLLAAGGLIATVYGPWQWYCIDKARQELFEIRARIFNLAASGSLDFNSPPYIAIRESLNIRLRFAHRVCWQQLLIFFFFHPKLRQTSNFSEQITLIQDEKLRSCLREEEYRATLALARLIVYRSPILLLAHGLVGAFYKASGGTAIKADSHWLSAGRRASIDAENVGPALDRTAAAA